MDSQDAKTVPLLGAINGSHLHWSDFREHVLLPFRIRCTGPPAPERFPSTFLAQLQEAQKNTSRYDVQRQAWRNDVAAGRGLNLLAVFPPNLLPQSPESSKTLRCMLPRMSREGLPLRSADAKNTLYELPTAKPVCVFGFNMDTFTKPEQAQLNGGLHVTGVSVDFVKGEVLPEKSVCCPILAFEKFTVNAQHFIEAARNTCAITGAQCLRGQQLLFNKASGLQSTSSPLVAFTCALNNEHAVINLHYMGEDREYNMAAICKFNLQDDSHFNTFLVWLEAIEAWANAHLLPRIQSAVAQVVKSHPSPPPSPSPPGSGHLSIDTKSSDILPVLSELRRLCPTIGWHNNMFGETPINSSMAQCGTPLGAREMRSFALSRLQNATSSASAGSPRKSVDGSISSPRAAKFPSAIKTDMSPLLPMPHHVFSPSDLSTSLEREPPDSPCRPSTLSPCTPGPEMPMSARNPILVLQKRLEVAMTEIQDLRHQVDQLQGQVSNRTDDLEKRFSLLSERQQDIQESFCAGLRTPTCAQSPIPYPEDPADDDPPKTPTSATLPPTLGNPLEDPTGLPFTTIRRMPGYYELDDGDEEDADLNLPTWFSIDKALVVWCLAKILRDTSVQLSLIVFVALTSYFVGHLDPRGLLANAFLMAADDQRVRSAFWDCHYTAMALYKAAAELNLEPDSLPPREGDCSDSCESEDREDGHGHGDVRVEVKGDDDEDGIEIRVQGDCQRLKDVLVECVPLFVYQQANG